MNFTRIIKVLKKVYILNVKLVQEQKDNSIITSKDDNKTNTKEISISSKYSVKKKNQETNSN